MRTQVDWSIEVVSDTTGTRPTFVGDSRLGGLAEFFSCLAARRSEDDVQCLATGRWVFLLGPHAEEADGADRSNVFWDCALISTARVSNFCYPSNNQYDKLDEYFVEIRSHFGRLFIAKRLFYSVARRFSEVWAELLAKSGPDDMRLASEVLALLPAFDSLIPAPLPEDIPWAIERRGSPAIGNWLLVTGHPDASVNDLFSELISSFLPNDFVSIASHFDRGESYRGGVFGFATAEDLLAEGRWLEPGAVTVYSLASATELSRGAFRRFLAQALPPYLDAGTGSLPERAILEQFAARFATPAARPCPE